MLVDDPRRFIHSSNDHKWLLSLNRNKGTDFDFDILIKLFQNQNQEQNEERFARASDFIRQNLLRFEMQSLINNTYDYSDEDLCLFRYFPHKQLVFFAPNEQREYKDGVKLVKTKTFQHLIRHILIYEFIKNTRFPFMYLLNNNTNYNIYENRSQIKEIDKLLNDCFIENHVNHYRRQKILYYENFVDIIDFVQFIVPIIFMPFISLIGIAFNILSIIVIFHKRNKEIYEENKRMLNYLAINSIFSICDCFLSSMTMISECLDLNSIFCSSIQMDAQYFRVYGIAFVSETMRTCSLLILLTFSLERYKLASNRENSILNKLIKINLKYFIGFYLLFSLLICAHKTFEFTIVDKFGYDLTKQEFPQHFTPENLSWFFKSLYIVQNVAFNFVLLILFTLFIDALLVRQTKANLKTKKEFLKRMLKESTGKSRQDLLKQLNDIKQATLIANQLLMFQMAMILFCRAPELLIQLFMITPLFHDLRIASFGLALTNLAKFFSLIPYLFNFFFYFKFNRSFRIAFKTLFSFK